LHLCLRNSWLILPSDSRTWPSSRSGSLWGGAPAQEARLPPTQHLQKLQTSLPSMSDDGLVPLLYRITTTPVSRTHKSNPQLGNRLMKWASRVNAQIKPPSGSKYNVEGPESDETGGSHTMLNSAKFVSIHAYPGLRSSATEPARREVKNWVPRQCDTNHRRQAATWETPAPC